MDGNNKLEKFRSFETERLLIRPTQPEDGEFIYQLLNTPKWLKNIGNRKVYSEEDGRKYVLNKMTPQLERLGFSNYTVIRKKDGVKIGTCGLYDREGLEGVDIGFAFLPEFEKKGYAFEASSCIKNAAFEEFDLSKINAITLKENLDSQKLLERLGLSFQEVITLPGESEELMLYSVSREN
ncbi:GNAT family N-acetyltransferase [Salinimicrobium gaetbulicola]|uniref:GNAT family N-acetyltransferase n=1 Tax=Salinimicrobium gaetbulicola TaxID=999702 RepID=A0ABW3IDI0_9FLAO